MRNWVLKKIPKWNYVCWTFEIRFQHQQQDMNMFRRRESMKKGEISTSNRHNVSRHE